MKTQLLLFLIKSQLVVMISSVCYSIYHDIMI